MSLKDKLQEYALIAEIIGGIAIVASLLFVGIQVRQTAEETSLNTRQMQAMTYQNLTEHIINLNRDYMQNPEIMKAILKAQQGEPLTDDELLRATATLRVIFRGADTAFLQYQNYIISEAQLDSLLLLAAFNMQHALGRRVLDDSGVSTEFKTYLLSNTEEMTGQPPFTLSN